MGAPGCWAHRQTVVRCRPRVGARVSSKLDTDTAQLPMRRWRYPHCFHVTLLTSTVEAFAIQVNLILRTAGFTLRVG